MFTGNVYNQIADIQAKLEAKQKVYDAVLATDESLKKIKSLHTEMKRLARAMQGLAMQVIISYPLAYYLD